MTSCPSCARSQVQSSAFCEHCGAVLDRPASAATLEMSKAAPASPARQTAPRATVHDVGDVGAYIVRRLLALAVDIFVVGALIAIAIRAWLANATRGSGLTVSGFLELVISVSVALFAYRWLFEGLAGTTPGKLVFGLAVARSGGGGVGLGRAFVRNLLLVVDLAIIGFLVAAITPQRRRLGDLLAGSVVVNSRVGALSPILGIALLGAAAYGVNVYAGGLSAAQHLARDATEFAPSLIGGATPAPTLEPSPPPSAAASPSPAASALPATSAPSPAVSPSPQGPT